jgi:hypothetical protein
LGLARAAEGATATVISRELGIPRRTVVDWLAGKMPGRRRPCTHPCTHDFAALADSYSYLLGLYLGDGCISTHRREVYRLRIVLDVKYPGIIAAAATAMQQVGGRRANALARRDHCVEVSAYWKCWPCLIPQHGPGKKHHRQIVLTDWQQHVVDRWPDQLLRGLIQSDGHRFQNSGRGNWSCPRYAFTNLSADIHAIFRAACDAVGVGWTHSAPHTTYISRKADVATLDSFIGPKR